MTILNVGKTSPLDPKPAPPAERVEPGVSDATTAPATSPDLAAFEQRLAAARQANAASPPPTPKVDVTRTFRDNLRDQTLDLMKGHGRAMRWVDLARSMLRWSPEVSHSEASELDDLGAIRAALSNLDIGDALTAAAGSLVVTAFKAAPRNSRGWVRNAPIRSFLPHDALSLDSSGRLERVCRGSTSGHLKLGLSSTSWGIARYGSQTVLSDEDLLADRVGVFAAVAEQTGRAAASLVEDLLFSLILRNPKLSDDVDLFHSDHNNLGVAVLADTAAAAGQAAIASQVLTDSAGDVSQTLNLNGSTLLVPPALGWTARELAKTVQLGDGQDLAVRVENRLGPTGVVDPDSQVVLTGTNTNWMLAVSHESWPCVLLGSLGGGDPEPKIRRFSLDKGQFGIGWDCLMDIGAVVTDYRGLYWSTGAGA